MSPTTPRKGSVIIITERSEFACSPPSSQAQKPDRRAFTLPQVIITMLISMIIMAAIASTFSTVMQRSISLNHYSDMDVQGRRALKYFTGDVRVALNAYSLSANGFILETPPAEEDIEYFYDSDAGTLSRITNTVTILLLNGLDSLTFKYHNLAGKETTKAIAAKKILMNATLVRGKGVRGEAYYDVSTYTIIRNKSVGY